jgi:glycogen operon protein
MDWRLLESNGDLFRFFRNLIAMRRRHPLLRRATFGAGGEGLDAVIEWHGVEQNRPDWSWESRLVACHQFEAGGDAAEHLYIIANAHWEALDCDLPIVSGGWRRVADTSLAPPDDCADADDTDAPQIQNRLSGRSAVGGGPRATAETGMTWPAPPRVPQRPKYMSAVRSRADKTIRG